MRIQFDAYSNIGGRSENEDSCFVQQVSADMVCAAVADGLGGHGGGKAASDITVKYLRQSTECDCLPEKEDILTWMRQANQEILATRASAWVMKTTAVFLAVKSNCAIWAHIGDSRLYHFYNESLVHYTLDHSMCQVAVHMGEIMREQIPQHPDRNRLLKVIGEEKIEPELHEAVELCPGRHAFLLCTDGLWERLQEQEIGLDLHKSPSPSEWLFNLRVRAEKRKWTDTDNNTAIALWIEI